MTDREILETFLSYNLCSPSEVFDKFLTLEQAKSYEHDGMIDCVYVPGTRQDRVLLVAHADTFWDNQCDWYSQCNNTSHKVFCDAGDIYRNLEDEVGIGADDRAGCAILCCLKDLGHSLLITNNEELGSIGAKNIREYHKELFIELNEHKYMIEFDRRNSHDYKVYGIPVTNEFKRFIELGTGYREAGRRSSTDITVLCDKICGVNLSVGYHYEHTELEYLSFREWKHTLDIARRMLEPQQSKYLLKQERKARL